MGWSVDHLWFWLYTFSRIKIQGLVLIKRSGWRLCQHFHFSKENMRYSLSQVNVFFTFWWILMKWQIPVNAAKIDVWGKKQVVFIDTSSFISGDINMDKNNFLTVSIGGPKTAPVNFGVGSMKIKTQNSRSPIDL